MRRRRHRRHQRNRPLKRRHSSSSAPRRQPICRRLKPHRGAAGNQSTAADCCRAGHQCHRKRGNEFAVSRCGGDANERTCGAAAIWLPRQWPFRRTPSRRRRKIPAEHPKGAGHRRGILGFGGCPDGLDAGPLAQGRPRQPYYALNEQGRKTAGVSVNPLHFSA